MEFIDVGDGVLVVDPFPQNGTVKDREEACKKILDTAQKSNKTYCIVSNDRYISNWPEFIDLLSQEGVDITAAPNILAKIGSKNLAKVRKSLIKEHFDEFMDHITDVRRAVELLDVILDDIGEGKYSRVAWGNRPNTIVFDGKVEAVLKYGKPKNDDDCAINSYIYIEVSDEVSYPMHIVTSGYNFVLYKPFTTTTSACYKTKVSAAGLKEEKDALKEILEELGLTEDSKEITAALVELEGSFYDVIISLKKEFVLDHIKNGGDDGIAEFIAD